MERLFFLETFYALSDEFSETLFLLKEDIQQGKWNYVDKLLKTSEAWH